MNWAQIRGRWKQVRGKFVRRWPSANSAGEGVERIGGQIFGGGQSEEQQAPFHPDDRGRRNEFSLHIGC